MLNGLKSCLKYMCFWILFGNISFIMCQYLDEVYDTAVINCTIPVHHLYYFLMGILFIVSLLGIMKAFIGLCSSTVEFWGLETFVECQCDFCDHNCFTRTRRKLFFLNIIFFFICPFLFIYYACESLNHNKCPNRLYDRDWIVTSQKKTVATVKNNQILAESYSSFNTDEEYEDLEYIKQVLTNEEFDLSNMPLVLNFTKTEDCCDQRLNIEVNNFACYTNAHDYVTKLLRTGIVYRNLKYPLGTIKLPKCCWYSIKGNFTITQCNSFKFRPISPFKQYWTYCDGTFINLDKPKQLNICDFQVFYENIEEVHCVNELSTIPKYFCINNVM